MQLHPILCIPPEYKDDPVVESLQHIRTVRYVEQFSDYLTCFQIKEGTFPCVTVNIQRHFTV